MSRGLRKGQLIGVHGPGAIADIGDESFVVTSIDKWRRDGMSPCDLMRLSRRLGVARLLQPATNPNRFRGDSWSVALHRFPQWLFCQKCRHMVRWSMVKEASLELGDPPCCERCKGRPSLVPMRFVQICENGHLDDVDWLWWVHSAPGSRAQCHNPEQLQFLSRTGVGSGLGSLQVKCLDCKAVRNLGDLRSHGGWQCRTATAYSGGRQPWQRSDAGTVCDSEPIVVQRGDSNVYFPSVVSALDIPSGSDDDPGESLDGAIRDRQDFGTYKGMWDSLKSQGIDVSVAMSEPISRLSQEVGVDPDHIVKLLDDSGPLDATESARPLGDQIREMKAEEFAALARPDGIESSQFSGTSYKVDRKCFSSALVGLLESVSLVDRLREVRTLRGFHRVSPSGEDRIVGASLSPATDWLPACEVFGEGIFLNFRPGAIAQWESGLPSSEQVRLQTLQKRIVDEDLGFLPKVSARLIAIHGLAHLLMRQLCFESGYASSSLRERMYIDDEMAGVLIYTADGDSEGTMGGLVRQGRSDRLPAVFARALTAAAWCSGDPLCSEGENQGMAGLNRAACHACLLVSETSCECANALLDRRFLIGGSGGMTGLFTGALAELEVV